VADPGSQSDGEAQDLVEPGLAERADELIARGLERYGEGDLEGALSEWEHALALAPGNPAAEEYVEYVRQNFDLLDEQFQHAKEVARAATEAGVPLGADDPMSIDYGYEEIEVTSGGTPIDDDDSDDADTTQGPAVVSPVIPGAQPAVAVDDGWALDGGSGVLELDDDLPGGSSAGGALPPEAGAEQVSVRADSSFELSSVSSDMLDLDDLPGPRGLDLRDRAESERSPAAAANDDEQTVPGGKTPPPLSEHAPISQDVLDAIDSVAADLERDRASEHEDTADFDQNKLRQLEGAPPDDRHDTRPTLPVSVTFHDVGTSEKTVPSRPSAPIDLSGLDIDEPGPPSVDLDDLPSAAELGLDEREDDEPTRERSGVVANWADFGSHEVMGETTTDEEATRQRTFSGQNTERPPTRDPMLSSVLVDEELLAETADHIDLRAPSVIVDDDDIEATREHVAVRPLDLTPFGGQVDYDNIEDIANRVLDELDEETPANESDSDRIRRRVQSLLDRARTERLAERDLLAAVVAELAVGEAPDSAIGQKLIHQHREMLLDVFRAFVGEPRSTPMVTVPMHQVAELDIDSRAAFLLSRIDGSLSFEEILDVCGMPELEAYRHLTRLLVAGILEVR